MTDDRSLIFLAVLVILATTGLAMADKVSGDAAVGILGAALPVGGGALRREWVRRPLQADRE